MRRGTYRRTRQRPKPETKTLNPDRRSHSKALHGPNSLAVGRELLVSASGYLSAWDQAEAALGHGAPDRGHLQKCQNLLDSATAILMARTRRPVGGTKPVWVANPAVRTGALPEHGLLGGRRCGCHAAA